MSNCWKSLTLTLAVTGLAVSSVWADEKIGCEDINWTPQVLAGFEDIEKACQEVVVRNDRRYVRFEVKLVNVESDGNMEVLMYLQDGSRVERVFHAPSDFQVLSRSGKTTFNVEELVAGDVLDVYVLESRIIGEPLGQEAS